MKRILLAALVTGLAAGFAVAEPQFQQRAPVLLSTTADAQTTFSAAEVGAARRAYRASCIRFEDAGVCECRTAAFAQSLTPSEVHLAAAEIAARHGRNMRVTRWNGADRAAALERIHALEAELAPTCNPTL
jgi:hypothetical protein